MRFKIEDLPPHMQVQVRAQLALETKTVQPVQPTAQPERTARPAGPAGPNKTEAAYRREVLDTNPAISRVSFEPMTFHLANGHRYTPDWGFISNGRLHLVEVKGAYRLGSYQRARLAFDQAAVEWPDFVWIWAERNGGTWKTSTSIRTKNSEFAAKGG